MSGKGARSYGSESASLGDRCIENWQYLSTAYKRGWEWLVPIFGDELEYRTSLVAYYMALSIHELASRIASGQQDMLKNAISVFSLNVPLTFLSENYSIISASNYHASQSERTHAVMDLLKCYT